MPALLVNVPEGIVWGRVTAYVTSFVADGVTALPDGTPDAIPLDGTITLTPTWQNRWLGAFFVSTARVRCVCRRRLDAR